ncbi:hypothetical protein [Mycoplana rhizolycopersici]|jgi:hypothetical protein|uniref:Uncharacterized protein n=1 Tax=Mycoplana rhizolycopersici TaxID=2746702 RepID=A0ABX2QDA4_9HYPH|nr:hypothetical protein [Rhizobium rhizolycopersici]NVP54934.1 hypothetical protein [Rhizobium rhizolycopersici]
MTPVLVAAAFVVATTQPTLDELQADFESARPCYALIDGREVWEGEKAFFISSFTKEAAELDPDLVGADAVLRDDNEPDVIAEFEAACSP